MHRTPTPPPPVSVIPPPLPAEVLPPPVAATSPVRARSLVERVFRDIKIGGVCLLLGLVIGQFGLIVQLQQQVASPSLDRALIAPLPSGHAEFASSTIDTQSLQYLQNLNEPAYSTDTDRADRETSALDAELRTIAEFDFAAAVKEEVSHEQETAPEEESGVDAIPTEERYASDLLVSRPTQPDPKDLTEPPLLSSPSIDSPVTATTIESLMSLTTSAPVTHPTCEDGTCTEEMETHGTLVKWADTPADAYRIAGERDKLVFMIHVSGNFEIPGFT